MSDPRDAGASPPRRAGPGPFGLGALGLGLLLLALGAVHAHGAADEGRTVLGVLSGPFAAAIRAGRALSDAGGARALSLARLTALAGLGLWLGFSWRRGAGRAGRRAAAVGVAAVAQSYLLSGSRAVAAVLYACAGAAWLTAPRAGTARALSPRVEAAVWAGALLLFTGAALHRLDLYPPQWFDEVLYVEAARMRLGQIEPGPILSMGSAPVYQYDRIRVQSVPLALQAGFAHVLAPTVVSLRLASVTAMGLALLVGALALRRHLGRRAAAWTLALAATAPLCLAYARNGQYMAVSSLHGAAAFAALLALHERWRPGAAALAGAVLGASLYFYQVSWFAPVLAALGFAVTPALWRRPRARRIVAIAAGSALLVAAPGLVGLREELRLVAGQTLFKGWWQRAPAPAGADWAAAFVVVPADQLPEVDPFLSSVGSPGLRAASRPGAAGSAVLQLMGSAAELERAVTAARERSWRVLDYGGSGDTPLRRALGMIETLLYRPGWESNGRWIDAPLLDPLLVPLLLLGALEAWRRRREPAARLLLVWVAGALLLPAVLGGPIPRRAVLALPFLYAFPALALVALSSDLAPSRVLRAATPALAALFFAAVVATNLHLHEERWHRDYAADADTSVLALSQRLHRLPRAERIMVSRRVERIGLRLADRGAARPGGPDRPARVRALSCAQELPFTWVMLDSEQERGVFDGLQAEFVTREERFGAFRLLRALERRPDGCGPGGR